MSRFAFACKTVLLWLLPLSSAMAQTVMLEPGVANRITLQPSTITNAIAIDIPAGTRHLQLEAVSDNGGDIDLLLRFGDPLPLRGNAGVFGGTAWLYEHAHYRSMSRGPSEWLSVTPYQPQPLREGRWYVAVVNYHAEATRIDITATLSDTDPEPAAITVDFNDAAGCAAQVDEDENGSIDPWFDDEAVAPIGDNPGTTLGEQRRNAFEHAMELIRTQVRPLAPIHVRACWANLGGGSDRATLASAGPYLLRNDNVFANRFGHYPGMTKAYTWHATAAALQYSGTDSCRFLGTSCTLPRVNIVIQFNSDIGNNDIINGRDFYYGFGTPPAQAIDFIATTMHEVTHGLGFSSTLNTDPDSGEPVGAKFRAQLSADPPEFEVLGHDDAYAAEVVLIDDNDQAHEINRLPEAERGAALTAGDALRWSGPEAAVDADNPWRDSPFPDNLPRLYAPDPIEPGSTLSHLDHANQLMAPFIRSGAREMGLAAAMLTSVGWNIPRLVSSPPSYGFPYGGQWFDPARTGHGIDLQRVVGSPDTYFLILYTYDADGLPEWYTATGRIVDGVFRPGDNEAGNSLWRWRGQGELDPTIGGQIRIDFDQAGRAPECDDGGARSEPLALMDFSITTLEGTEQHRWCLTQLLPETVRPEFDTTGTWYAGSDDSGWGISTLALPSAQSVGLNMIVYYFDGADQPRWALGETADFSSGTTITLNQYSGYCRSCDIPAGGVTRIGNGEATVTLDPPHGNTGRISLDIGFDGPGGGRFQRDDSPMILLGESPPADD